MPQINLTNRTVANLHPLINGQVDYYDAKNSRFGVRISYNGTKTWFVFDVDPQTGKRRRITLGRYPEMTLAEARSAALDHKHALLVENRDPVAERKAQQEALTFNGLIDIYIDQHAKPKKRSWKEDQRILSKYFTRWDGHRADSITRPEVVTALQDIKKNHGGVMATSAEANYNDWMTEAQFLIVEEAKDVSREDFYSAYENFKQIVDIRVMPVRVNPKYGRTRNDFAFFNALIFSNHSDALALPENDRRVAVLTNPREMETPAYYDALEASLSNGEPRRIYWYLMRRDVSAFDHVYPPMTPGKRLMTCQHQSPGDEIKAHIVETWGSDLVTRESLASAVIAAASALDHNKIMISPGGITRMIWGRLGPLREEKNGARYVINDERVEVRAIREKAVWMGKDADRQAETVIEELEKSARGGSGMSIAPNMG